MLALHVLRNVPQAAKAAEGEENFEHKIILVPRGMQG